MADDGAQPGWRQTLKTAAWRSLLGLVLALGLRGMMEFSGLWALPTDHYLNDGSYRWRQSIASAAAQWLAYTLAFMSPWLAAEQRRHYHPIVVGFLATAALRISYRVDLPLHQWLADFTDTRAILYAAMITGFIVRIAAPFALPWLAASVAMRLRLPTKKGPRQLWVAWLFPAAVLLASWLVIPRAKRPPVHASLPQRHAWALQNFAPYYPPAAQWLRDCEPLADELGSPLVVAPSKDGRFVSDNAHEQRVLRIDFDVRGTQGFGTCRLDAFQTDDASRLIPYQIVREDWAGYIALCQLPDHERFELPVDCVCGECQFDCDDSTYVLGPRAEIPANVEMLRVPDRPPRCVGGSACARPALRTRDLVVERVEPEDGTIVRAASSPVAMPDDVAQGQRYRLRWTDSICGERSLTFNVGPAIPLEPRIVVSPQNETGDLVQVEVTRAEEWVPLTGYTVSDFDGYLRPGKDRRLRCYGPRYTEFRATAVVGPDPEPVRYEYECPNQGAR